MFEYWFSHPKTRTAVAILLAGLVAWGLAEAEFGEHAGGGTSRLTIRIQHFGVDAESMERSVTIPLEDRLAGIEGVREIRSYSELNTSRVDLTLAPGTDTGAAYLAVRDGVDDVYAALPSSVQRPEVFASSSNDSPLMIIAFEAVDRSENLVRSIVERDVEPLLESFEETGEIEVAGGTPLEIHIELIPDVASRQGIGIQDVANLLRAEYGRVGVGEVDRGAQRLAMTADARFRSIGELSSLRIAVGDAGTAALSTVAQIGYAGKETETISRLDGDRRVLMYVKGSGLGSPVTLSRRVRDSLTAFDTLGSSVVYDYGREIEDAIQDAALAVLIAIVVLSGLVWLLVRSVRTALLLAAYLVSALLAAIATMASLGFPVSVSLLTGMGVGIGLVADAALVLVTKVDASRPTLAQDVRRITPALIASTATTLIVLVPLFMIPDAGRSLLAMARAFGALIAVSVPLALLFLPAHLEGGSLPRRARKQLWRFRVGSRRGGVVRAASLAVLAVLAIASLFFLPREAAAPAAVQTVFGQLEFSSGTHVEFVDAELEALAGRARQIPGVTKVETLARRTNGTLSVRFDPTATSTEVVTAALRELSENLVDGFLYLPGETADRQSVTIDVIGPDDPTLRGLAVEAVGRISREAWVVGSVYHFKEGDPAKVFAVDRQALSTAGLSAGVVADTLRWKLYGPVGFKWIDEDGETDVRIMGEGFATVGDLDGLFVERAGAAAVPLTPLGAWHEEESPGRITRINRQRAKSFSISVPRMPLGELLSQLTAAISSIPMPMGYALRIDPRLAESSEAYDRLAIALLAAGLLVFMILAAQYESFSAPLLVFVTIPASLALPLVLLAVAGRPLTINLLLGFVIVSGLVVNSAILVVDAFLAGGRRRGAEDPAAADRSAGGAGAGATDSTSPAPHDARRVSRALRSRFESLVLTTGSTLAGLLPLFVHPGLDGTLKDLAFVLFWGVAGSFLVTMVGLPGVLWFATRSREPR